MTKLSNVTESENISKTEEVELKSRRSLSTSIEIGNGIGDGIKTRRDNMNAYRGRDGTGTGIETGSVIRKLSPNGSTSDGYLGTAVSHREVITDHGKSLHFFDEKQGLTDAERISSSLDTNNNILDGDYTSTSTSTFTPVSTSSYISQEYTTPLPPPRRSSRLIEAQEQQQKHEQLPANLASSHLSSHNTLPFTFIPSLRSSWISPSSSITSTTQPKVASVRNLDDRMDVNVNSVASVTPSALITAPSERSLITTPTTPNTFSRLTKAYPANKEEGRLFARPVTMSINEKQQSTFLQTAPGPSLVPPPRVSSVVPNLSGLKKDTPRGLEESVGLNNGVDTHREDETKQQPHLVERGRKMNGGGLVRTFSFENLLGSRPPSLDVVSVRELPGGELVGPNSTISPTLNDEYPQLGEVLSAPQSPVNVSSSGSNTGKTATSKIINVFKNGESGGGGFSSLSNTSNSPNTSSNSTPTVLVSRSLGTVTPPDSVSTDSKMTSGISPNTSSSGLPASPSQQQTSIGVLGYPSLFRHKKKPKTMNSVVVDEQPPEFQQQQSGLSPISPSSSITSIDTIGSVNAALFGSWNASLAVMDFYDSGNASVEDGNVADVRFKGDVKSRMESNGGSGCGVEGRDAMDGPKINLKGESETDNNLAKRKTSWVASGSGRGDNSTTTPKTTKPSRKARRLSRERTSGNVVGELSPSSKTYAETAIFTSACNAIPLGNGIFVDVATGHLIFHGMSGLSPTFGGLAKSKTIVGSIGNNSTVVTGVGLGIGFGSESFTGLNSGRNNGTAGFTFDSTTSPVVPGSGLSNTTTTTTTPQTASLAQRRTAFRAKMKTWSVFAGISNLNGSGGNSINSANSPASVSGDLSSNNDPTTKSPLVPTSGASFKNSSNGRWSGYNDNLSGLVAGSMLGQYQDLKDMGYSSVNSLSPLLMLAGIMTPILRRSRLVIFEEDGSVRAIDGGEEQQWQQQLQLKEKMDVGKSWKKQWKGGSGKGDGGIGNVVDVGVALADGMEVQWVPLPTARSYGKTGKKSDQRQQQNKKVLRVVNGCDEFVEEIERGDGVLQEVDSGDEFLVFTARGNVVVSSSASPDFDKTSPLFGTDLESSTTAHRQSRLVRPDSRPLRAMSPPPRMLSAPSSPRLRRPLSLDPSAFLRLVNGSSGNGVMTGSSSDIVVSPISESEDSVAALPVTRSSPSLRGEVLSRPGNDGGKKDGKDGIVGGTWSIPSSPKLLGKRLKHRLSWTSLSNALVTATSPPSSPAVDILNNNGTRKSHVKKNDKQANSYPPIFTQSPLPIGYFDPLAGAKIISSPPITPPSSSVSTVTSRETAAIIISPNLASPSTSWLTWKPSNPKTTSSPMLRTSISTPNLSLMAQSESTWTKIEDDRERGLRRVQSGASIRSIFGNPTLKGQSVGFSRLDGEFDPDKILDARRDLSPDSPPLLTQDDDESGGQLSFLPIDDPPSTSLALPKSLLSSHLNSARYCSLVSAGGGSSPIVSFKSNEIGEPNTARDSPKFFGKSRGPVTSGKPGVFMRRALSSSDVDIVSGYDNERRVSPFSAHSPIVTSSRFQFDSLTKRATTNTLSSSYSDGVGVLEETQVGSKWGQRWQDSLSKVRNFTRRASSGDLFKKARTHGMGGFENTVRGRSEGVGASVGRSVDSWDSTRNSTFGWTRSESPARNSTQSLSGVGAGNGGSIGHTLPIPLVQTPRSRFPIEDADDEVASETLSRRSGATGLYSQFSGRIDTAFSSYSVRRKRTVSSKSSETGSTGRSVHSFPDSNQNQTSTASSKKRPSDSWDINSSGQQQNHRDTVNQLSKSQPVEGYFGGRRSVNGDMEEVVRDREWESDDEQRYLSFEEMLLLGMNM
ncbi:hypothetical protein HDU76_004032 [Blyttiomyces sp. JEL0837]|nr:hypothetical protein HDU76_004032 [Blyttiomyces sp. JEL0837]